MSQSLNQNFGRLRAFLWPIHKHENRKIIPMLLMALLISFNYNILKTAKDTVIITAKGSGAETIPFIKVWVLLPMALLFTYIFAKLSSKVSREKVFYIIVSLFLSFYFLFITVLYPARDFLHPHLIADHLETLLPIGCKGFIALFRNWTFTTYYVMAELWSNIILSLLFWGFANEISNVTEAKRFYGLLGIGLNIAGIFSGQISIFFSGDTLYKLFPLSSDPWQHTLILLNSTVIICGLAIIAIFRWLHTHDVIKDSICPIKNPKSKIKMSLTETFRYLAKSRYLMYIACIVVAYSLVINLVEVLWKSELRLLFPNPNDYNIHINKVTSAVGIIATLGSLCVSGQAVRKCGWTFTALITPIFLGVATLGFFFFFFMKVHFFDLSFGLLGVSPLLMLVLFGSLHNTLSRSAKYTVFDTTKEIAFIPLSRECKLKGKAAIDGVGSRLGKSGGSLIYQILLMIFSTLPLCAPYISVLVLVAIISWIFAAKALGKQFNSLIEHHETISINEDANNDAAIITPAEATSIKSTG